MVNVFCVVLEGMRVRTGCKNDEEWNCLLSWNGVVMYQFIGLDVIEILCERLCPLGSRK